MASANLVDIRYIAETTLGTTPTSVTGARPLRITGESLQLEQDYVSSTELRSDRGRSRGTRTGARVTGDLNFELSIGNIDELIRGLCQRPVSAAWSTPTGVASNQKTAAVAAASGAAARYHHDDDNTFDAFVPGQFVRVSGFTTAANNGLKRVLGVASTGSELLVAGALTTEAKGDDVTIAGAGLDGSGTAKQSFTFEKAFTDAQQFIQFRGCRIANMSLDVSPGAIVTGTLGVLGTSSSLTSGPSGRVLGTTNTPSTGRVLNAVTDASFLIDDVAVAGATNLALTIEPNLREIAQIGVYGASDIELGSVAVSGTLEAITNDFSRYQDMVAGTARRMSMILEDGDKFLAFHIPQVDFTQVTALAEGIDTDVAFSINWEASVDAAGSMFTVSRG